MSTVAMPPERRSQPVEPPRQDAPATPVQFDVLSIAVLVSRHVRFLAWSTFIVTAIVAGLLLLLRPEYTTHASFMPQSSRDDIGSSISGGMGSISGLAASFGLVGGGGEISPKFYADLATSDRVLMRVLDTTARRDSAGRLVKPPFNYIREFDIDAKTPQRLREKAIKHLRSNITVDFEPRTSVTHISFRGDTPQFSVQVLQALLQALNEFNVQVLQGTAHSRTVFLEGRVAEADSERRASEAVLREFMIENRTYAESPTLRLRQMELEQDHDIKNDRYIELSSSLDRARLQEVKDTPVLTILDTPQLPGIKTGPKRTLLSLATAFVWLTLAVSWLAGRDALRAARQRHTTEFAAIEQSWRSALPFRRDRNG